MVLKSRSSAGRTPSSLGLNSFMIKRRKSDWGEEFNCCQATLEPCNSNDYPIREPSITGFNGTRSHGNHLIGQRQHLLGVLFNTRCLKTVCEKLDSYHRVKKSNPSTSRRPPRDGQGGQTPRTAHKWICVLNVASMEATHLVWNRPACVLCRTFADKNNLTASRSRNWITARTRASLVTRTVCRRSSLHSGC